MVRLLSLIDFEVRHYIKNLQIVNRLDECLALNGYKYLQPKVLQQLENRIDNRIKHGLDFLPANESKLYFYLPTKYEISSKNKAKLMHYKYLTFDNGDNDSKFIIRYGHDIDPRQKEEAIIVDSVKDILDILSNNEIYTYTIHNWVNVRISSLTFKGAYSKFKKYLNYYSNLATVPILGKTISVEDYVKNIYSSLDRIIINCNFDYYMVTFMIEINYSNHRRAVKESVIVDKEFANVLVSSENIYNLLYNDIMQISYINNSSKIIFTEIMSLNNEVVKVNLKDIRGLDWDYTRELNQIYNTFNNQMVCIVGGKGSGKSTMLRLLASANKNIYILDSDYYGALLYYLSYDIQNNKYHNDLWQAYKKDKNKLNLSVIINDLFKGDMSYDYDRNKDIFNIVTEAWLSTKFNISRDAAANDPNYISNAIMKLGASMSINSNRSFLEFDAYLSEHVRSKLPLIEYINSIGLIKSLIPNINKIVYSLHTTSDVHSSQSNSVILVDSQYDFRTVMISRSKDIDTVIDLYLSMYYQARETLSINALPCAALYKFIKTYISNVS